VEQTLSIIDAKPTHRPATRPAVTRTFVFIDIVGSTSLIDAIGDWAWVELLSWHERTLGVLFESHGGELVDQAGDGFFVAFAEPSAAIACAVAIQRVLAHQRQTNCLALDVRIGLHRAGVLRCGVAYRGKGVHVAARIARLAAGGEILASCHTVEASGPSVAASVPHAVELAGISDPVHVQRIEWSEDLACREVEARISAHRV
jgi:class 3 adenylate cyclase